MNCKQLIPGIIVLLLLPLSRLYGLPAFPGAEGMGASTTGGRGGTVVFVTNLNDSGAGSLRAACDTSGPRIVVFNVSGTINLASLLEVATPYITIAGQTSPGGICIAGYPFKISTHDVVITHMRFRVGSHGMGAVRPDDVHSVEIRGTPASNAFNIIFDHCSMSWGIDETVEISGASRDITFSHCIIGEGLDKAGHSEGHHGAGMLLRGKDSPRTVNVSIHHCFFTQCHFRMPETGHNVFLDAADNVVYFWYGSYTPQFGSYMDANGAQYSRINYRHNYSRMNPRISNDFSRECTNWSTAPSSPVIFVEGNLGCTRVSPDDPQWCVGDEWQNRNVSTDWQRSTPWPSHDIPLTVTTMTISYALLVIENAGATRPSKDILDVTLAENFRTYTGSMRDTVTWPADWPVFSTSTVRIDNDNDGMDDHWETANGCDPSINDAAADNDNNGYTNIEEYLRYLGGYGSASGNVARHDNPPVKR